MILLLVVQRSVPHLSRALALFSDPAGAARLPPARRGRGPRRRRSPRRQGVLVLDVGVARRALAPPARLPDGEHGLGAARRDVRLAALDVLQVPDLEAVLREQAPHGPEGRLEFVGEVRQQVLELAHRVGADEDARLVVAVAVDVHRHPLAHLGAHELGDGVRGPAAGHVHQCCEGYGSLRV